MTSGLLQMLNRQRAVNQSQAVGRNLLEPALSIQEPAISWYLEG